MRLGLSACVFDFPTEPEDGIDNAFALVDRQAVALRPARKRKSLTGGLGLFNHNSLPCTTGRFQGAVHHKRTAHIKARTAVVIYAGVERPAAGTLKVSVFEQVVGVGIRIVFELSRVDVHRASVADQHLYFDALSRRKLKRCDQPDIF